MCTLSPMSKKEANGTWVVVLAVAFYMSVGPGIIIVNRNIMKEIG